MTKEERIKWIARGFKDPRAAYGAHVVSATQRGVEFKLTFAEWWSLWEPHYAKRGRHAGQMCMCRTGDAGAYEIGNVRIDTVMANAAEAAVVRRRAQLQSGRLPAEERCLPAPDDWVSRRGYVFKPYEEEEEC